MGVQWTCLALLDLPQPVALTRLLQVCKAWRNAENLQALPKHLFSFFGWKRLMGLGKSGNVLAGGKLFKMAMWLISTSFLQLESILGQELHPGNQAFKFRLRRKIACIPFGMFLLKIAHTAGNWCPASANWALSGPCSFFQQWETVKAHS